jgi:hypothetical protein
MDTLTWARARVKQGISPALLTMNSTATAERKDNIHYGNGNFLRAKHMPMALDLASAVTMRLTAGWLAAQSVNVLFQICLLSS